MFLAELGSAIVTALQTAITPSLTAAPYHHHKKLSFLLYVVTDHESYKPTAPANFNVEVLKK